VSQRYLYILKNYKLFKIDMRQTCPGGEEIDKWAMLGKEEYKSYLMEPGKVTSLTEDHYDADTSIINLLTH